MSDFGFGLLVVDLSSLLPHVFEDLDPMVVAVRDIYLVISANRHAGGQSEFSGMISTLPDVQQQLPAQVENLQIIEHRVGDINVAERVRGDSFGPSKMTGGISVAAESGDEFPREIEYLHAAIQGISHEKMPLMVSGDVRLFTLPSAMVPSWQLRQRREEPFG